MSARTPNVAARCSGTGQGAARVTVCAHCPGHTCQSGRAHGCKSFSHGSGLDPRAFWARITSKFASTSGGFINLKIKMIYKEYTVSPWGWRGRKVHADRGAKRECSWPKTAAPGVVQSMPPPFAVRCRAMRSLRGTDTVAQSLGNLFFASCCRGAGRGFRNDVTTPCGVSASPGGASPGAVAGRCGGRTRGSGPCADLLNSTCSAETFGKMGCARIQI